MGAGRSPTRRRVPPSAAQRCSLDARTSLASLRSAMHICIYMSRVGYRRRSAALVPSTVFSWAPVDGRIQENRVWAQAAQPHDAEPGRTRPEHTNTPLPSAW